MVNIPELRQLFAYFYNDYYSAKRGQQLTDLEYYNDEFKVDQIDPLFPISRTGGGKELIDEPVAQLSSGKLNVTRLPLKGKRGEETETTKESALRISRTFNENWIPRLIRTNPNPIMSFIKNQFLYGEAWLHPVHNDSWVTGKMERNGLPVLFPVPDPLTIYASPNEDENGIPEYGFVYYMRLPWVVKAMYPHWDNPKGKKQTKRETVESYLTGKRILQGFVEWLEYWDKEKRYFEADGQTVLESENIYGVTPLVHKVSGWGTASPDGLPEDMVVGRLRAYRDLLKRECNMTTDVDGQFHMFANKSIWVQPETQQVTIPKDFSKNFRMGSGWLNELPYGLKWDFMESGEPSVQALNYLFALKGELGRKTPGVMSGDTLGGSGRLQDIAYSIAFKKYEQQVRNTQYAFETAFGMGLKMLDKVPTLRPDELHEGDIGDDYNVIVELKPDDPLENERLATRGLRMWQAGAISFENMLTKYMGFSPEEAHQQLKDVMRERIVFSPNSPFSQLLALRIAQKYGMAQELQAMMAMGQSADMSKQPTPTDMMRTQGEIETPLGSEMIDQSLTRGEARRSPLQ